MAAAGGRSTARWHRRQVHAALSAVVVISTATVAGTGVWLALRYRPGPWDSTGPTEPDLGGGWIHEAHAASAIVLTGAAIALIGSLVLAALRRSPQDAGPVVLGGLAVGTALVLAFHSARDLRFELIALWAVTVDESLEGIWPLAFDDAVRFFIVPGRGEVLPAEFRTEVLAHTIAAPLLALVAAIGTVALSRRRRP